MASLLSIIEDLKILGDRYSVWASAPTWMLSNFQFDPVLQSGSPMTRCRELLDELTRTLDETSLPERRRWNAQRPINRLPEELLIHILRLSQSPPKPAISPGSIDNPDDLSVFWWMRKLTSTCHWWRNCAIRYRSLWSTLVIRPGTQAESLAVLAARCKDVPLEIDIVFSHDHPDDVVRNTRVLLERYSTRCITLRVKTSNTWPFPLRGQFHQLKNLAIAHSGEQYNDHWFEVEDHSQLPDLQNLDIELYNNEEPVLPGLTQINFNRMQSLSVCRIDHVARDCLQLAPMLEKLEWRGLAVDESTDVIELGPCPLILSNRLHFLFIDSTHLSYLSTHNNLNSVIVLALSPSMYNVHLSQLVTCLNQSKLQNIEFLDIAGAVTEHFDAQLLCQIIGCLNRLQVVRFEHPPHGSGTRTVVKYAASTLGRPESSTQRKLDILIEFAWFMSETTQYTLLLDLEQLLESSKSNVVNIYANLRRSDFRDFGGVNSPFIHFEGDLNRGEVLRRLDWGCWAGVQTKLFNLSGRS